MMKSLFLVLILFSFSAHADSSMGADNTGLCKDPETNTSFYLQTYHPTDRDEVWILAGKIGGHTLFTEYTDEMKLKPNGKYGERTIEESADRSVVYNSKHEKMMDSRENGGLPMPVIFGEGTISYSTFDHQSILTIPIQACAGGSTEPSFGVVNGFTSNYVTAQLKSEYLPKPISIKCYCL
jgi:hypothetical protein